MTYRTISAGVTGAILLTALCLAPSTTASKPEGPVPPPPSVEDLAWLAGDWRSEHGQDVTQEVWTAPRAGVMTGMFRLIREGEVVVMEYLVVSEEAEGIYYRFKHFLPDYTSWEDDQPPIQMELVVATPGRAVFRNIREVAGQPAYIVYLLSEEGRLTILVGDSPEPSDDYLGFRFVLTSGHEPSEGSEQPRDR